jgi:dipeptidyl aminopeptidase/acylaminoacyl peptidase
MGLMAMFRAPDVFRAGAALRPVSDWSEYNDDYTSAIFNTPDIDPQAYKTSSPIEYAEGLRGSLLICHGMMDDNVFFQDSVRLVQRLIELHKTDWTFEPYPLERHEFEDADAWLDEYRRIDALFERTLK